MKKVIILSFIFVFLIGITGCDTHTGISTQGLTIGLMPDVNSIPFIIAEEKGFFQDAGANVKLEQFKSAVDRDTALQTGNIDGAVSDMLSVLFFVDQNFDVKITSQSEGSYKMVMGNSQDIDAQSLQGKKIGLSKNTIIEYITDQIIQEYGVDPASMDKIAIPKIPTRLEMLQTNEIDMATLPDPLASVAVHNGGKILNSSDGIGIEPSVILFSGQSIENKTQQIKTMYEGYNRAVEYLNSSPREEYIELVIEKAGFPPEVRDILELPHYQKAALPPTEEFDQVNQWMQSKDLISQSYSFKDLVSTEFAQ